MGTGSILENLNLILIIASSIIIFLSFVRSMNVMKNSLVEDKLIAYKNIKKIKKIASFTISIALILLLFSFLGNTYFSETAIKIESKTYLIVIAAFIFDLLNFNMVRTIKNEMEEEVGNK